MVTVMLEPLGAIATYDVVKDQTIFTHVEGGFHRVSFAYEDVICAFHVGYYYMQGGSEVYVDGSYIDLIRRYGRALWQQPGNNQYHMVMNAATP